MRRIQPALRAKVDVGRRISQLLDSILSYRVSPQRDQVAGGFLSKTTGQRIEHAIQEAQG
jgi:hypothetical protein